MTTAPPPDEPEGPDSTDGPDKHADEHADEATEPTVPVADSPAPDTPHRDDAVEPDDVEHTAELPDESPAAAGAASAAEDPGEAERVRAELARLEARLEEATPAAEPSGSRAGGVFRTIAVIVCGVLVALLAPLSVVATWANDQMSDTDRYVDTVAPLANDPAVQRAVTDKITTAITERLDVQAVTKEAVDALANQGLPPRVATSLSALSTPLANGVNNFIHDQVQKLVESDAFADAWVQANREAHAQMVALLTGDTNGGAVEVEGNAVKLNLAVLVKTVQQQLVEAGFTLAGNLPTVSAEFTLFESADIAKAQTGSRLLTAVAHVLPFLALGFFVLGIVAARRRRRALFGMSLVVAGSMLMLGALLNVFRIIYLDAVPPDQLPPDAAAVIFDQTVRFIRFNLRAVLVLFLAIAIVAWVSGPEPGQVAVRRAGTKVFDAVRHGSDRAGLDTGAFGEALGRSKNIIRAVIGGAVIVVYVMAAHPTGSFTLWLLAIALLLLVIVEVLARNPRPEPEPVAEESTPAT